MVAQQQQVLHPSFGSRDEDRPHPVPHLDPRLETRLPRQIETVLTNYQRQSTCEIVIGCKAFDLIQHLIQLIRCCTALDLRL